MLDGDAEAERWTLESGLESDLPNPEQIGIGMVELSIIQNRSRIYSVYEGLILAEQAVPR
jgi:hypothetical protein